MLHHTIIELIRKVENLYHKELERHFSVMNKSRLSKLYKLIKGAKNEEQLKKELLFSKLFGKSYSEKNDYLWRNEIRLLKEELERFLIIREHENLSKNNNAYNDWLLIQAYDRVKYVEGIDEKYNNLIREKDNYASYAFVLDACLLQLNNLHYKITDISKRLNTYPNKIDECKMILNDLVSAYCSKINVYIAYHNWISYNHKSGHTEPFILDNSTLQLTNNPISNFHNHYAMSFTTSAETDAFEKQLDHLNKSIEVIEPLFKYNKLLAESRFLVMMSKGRELSANGRFEEAHETLSEIKKDVNQLNLQYKTSFYVNYITNLVKCKYYKEALHTLENEFSTDNFLYKNMLLQNRLLCYLYLRDTKQLGQYISYDLDAAPFPQNYMLKVIKSAYFYLIQDYDTAINIINSLLNAKYATDNMQYYQPISVIYKKLYSGSESNRFLKKWEAKDLQKLRDGIEDYENNAPPEFKNVSVYLWLKDEIERNIF